MLGIISQHFYPWGFILIIIIFHFVSKVAREGISWGSNTANMGPGSIPGRGTKIQKAVWQNQKKKIFF